MLILKEIFDLTDEETLEHLEYNLLWQYALDIRFDDAHICRKTLHNFRIKLLESGRHRKVFNLLTKKIIELFGLKIGRQRLDSTHVVGNMKIVGRLGLFVQTIEQFLFKLKKMAENDAEIASLLKELPEQYHKRYLEREGYFGDSRSSKAPRRLHTCARDIWILVQLFKNHGKISKLRQFKTLKRLFKEQCEIVYTEEGQREIQAVLPDHNEDDSCSPAQGEEEPEQTDKKPSESQVEEPVIEVKKKQEIKSDSLQSPTDPDATYGHKGKGYETQVAETCDSENPFQVITGTHLNGANESDQAQTIPMIEKLEQAEFKPEELQVDAGYVSGKNIVEAEDKGTRLIGPLPGKPPNPEKIPLDDFEFNENGTRINQCPNQKRPVQQGTSDNDEHWAVFLKEDCCACPFYANCPVKGKRERRIEWDREKLAIAKRHREVQTREFKEEYRIRSGIEATNSELKNKHGAAKLKVRGHTRIDFAMTFKSLAINIKRMIHYVIAELKRTGTNRAKNPIFALICVLASLTLIFIEFARQKISSALKGSNFGGSPFQGINPLAMDLGLYEALR